jgi:hypothetical protein
MSSLTCQSCHGTSKTSSIKVIVHTKDGGSIKKENIDLDGNHKIDAGEWHHLQALLQKNLKGKFKITKDYSTDVDVHGVMKKAQDCKSCHTSRQVFGKANLHYSGAVTFELPLDPSVIVPEIPPLDSYRKTVHGAKGVACNDCHGSLERISDGVCVKCHQDIAGVYRNTVHAQKGATQCTHCHNPHRIEAYKERTASERLAVCSRCHQDYVQKHKWLPNTTQHFKHLECSTCHSPQSTKSMVFFLSTKKGDKDEILHYETMEGLYGKNISVTPLLDKNSDELIDSQELADFFNDVRKKLAGNAFIGSSIVVTSVYHDYSVTRQKERICATCHSDKAPFYESMLFILPEKGYHMYIPVKGTILSATPVSVFIDISLLGEQRATWSDIKGYFFLRKGGFSSYAKELGFKWIDIIGIGLSFVVLFFILVHAVLRLVIKK